MKLLQHRYIVLIVILLISALSELPLFAGTPMHNNPDMPDTCFAQQSLDSHGSLLPPSLMNYGVSNFGYNPRDSRRMSGAETAALVSLSCSAFQSSHKSIKPHKDQLLDYVSLRRHGFAYTGGEEDPFSLTV